MTTLSRTQAQSRPLFSLVAVLGLMAAGCGDDPAGTKDAADQDAQPRGGSSDGGGNTLDDLGVPEGGSTGGNSNPGGFGEGGTTGGSVGGSGGAGGGNDNPDGSVGGAGGEPVGGSGGTPAGGAGGEPVGGSGGTPVAGAGGEIPVGGAAGGAEPPPPLPDGDYAYARIGTAAIASAGEASCSDFNGDGQADNSFAGLGAFANGQLQTAIDEFSLNLLPVSIGLPAGAADGALAVAVLTGEPNGAAYDVSPNALDENGDPLIAFNPAQANGGRLQAGPGNFILALPVQGVDVILNLTDASITGNISVDQAQGLTIGQGTIAGEISQEDLDAALVVVPAEFAGLIPIFLRPDLDSDGDGTADSYSLCLTFEANPAVVNGFPVIAP